MLSRSEVQRLLPFSLLLFCLCGAYCMLRAIKDVITLTAHDCGAEIFPFLKVWGLFPASVFMATLFAWLSQRLRRETIFYIFLGTFLLYFFCFAHYIYPNMEALRLDHLEVKLHYYLPAGCEGLIQMIVNWPASLFYVITELWPTAMMAVLFWGFANQSFSTEEASRSYGVLKIGATASALCAGLLAASLTTKSSIGGTWESSFIRQIYAVCFLGLCSMGIFAYLQKHVIKRTPEPERQRALKRRSLGHSLRVVMADRRLLNLAVIVLSYNLVYNCTDVLWKAQLKMAYPDPNELMRFIAKVSTVVGAISVVAALSSAWIVRRLGWLALALITPAAMMVLSVTFFLVMFFGKSEGVAVMALANAAPVGLLVSIGAAQNALSKACKYSVFDISKEIAFTSLDRETQWNGKTAIDGIGNDLGKTGASLSQQILLLSFGSLGVAAPWLAAIILVVLVAWIYASVQLGRAQSQPQALEAP